MNKTYDVIVVGGGAAGLMAAGRAAERGKRVLLLEKNKTLGQKLAITGGGRCNITNAEFDSHIFLKNYGTAASFLHSPLSQFGIQDTFRFFESHGLPLVIHEGKRAFPQTERATDVVRVLEEYVREGNVAIQFNTRIDEIVRENNKVVGVFADGKTYTGDALIIATGGTSHPETGSTGDGFEWLRDLGHTVLRPTPTIVPLAVRERFVQQFAGVSLADVKITYVQNNKKQFSKKGNLLFTHFGISGPVVLNSSGRVGDLLQSGPVSAVIDMFPDSDEQELENRMIALFDENKNKTLKNIFTKLAPLQILATIKGVNDEIKIHSVTREQRKALVYALKYFTLTVTGLMGLDRAVVVDGGVDIQEIRNKTMQSTIIENLYIVGDLLNIRRPSGGYSLQLCWTTGFVAGESV